MSWNISSRGDFDGIYGAYYREKSGKARLFRENDRSKGFDRFIECSIDNLVIVEILFFHLDQSIRETKLEMVRFLSSTATEPIPKFIDGRRKEKEGLNGIISVFEKRFQMNHPLGIHDVERIFSELDDALKLGESRPVVVPMNERVLDHIPRVYPSLELFASKKIVVLSFYFPFTSSTGGGRDNLLEPVGVLGMEVFPNGRLPDSGRSGKYQNMRRRCIHKREEKNI